MAKTAFLGLGVMGYPMAGHMARAGHEVTVYNRTAAKAEKWVSEYGGAAAATPREAAQGADFVMACVGNDDDLRGICTGEDGAFAGMSSGATFVDHTTVSQQVTLELAEQAAERGLGFVDAPVSGGEVGAKNGALTIMVGGSEPVFNKVKPLFELMGKNITLVGGNGDGQTCKVANQIIVGITVEAVAEALLFASKAGADPGKVRQALMGGAANSLILENHGQRMLDRDFTQSFRVALQHKDLGLAVEAAKSLGMVLPNATNTWQLYNSCLANGDADADHIAILKVLESLANYQLSTEE